MRVHFLGVCGTFMAGIAIMAKQLGLSVTGSDEQCYPPMSTVLANAGVTIIDGYANDTLTDVDRVVVGNVISRGNVALEHYMRQGVALQSGPAWLAEQVLATRHVLAVSGTHGKTTTAALLAWLLESAGMNPGFLIGGAPHNFPLPVRLTDSPFIVIEADEYDSAFFDKRPKFMHYFPDTLIVNNLEFDHADIYPSFADITRQFGYLLRTVSPQGEVIYPAADTLLTDLVGGCPWLRATPVMAPSAGWSAQSVSADASEFTLQQDAVALGTVRWPLIGEYNMRNAVSACAAASAVGVTPSQLLAGLASFSGVKKRLEKKACIRGITVYEDFAHHPTAVNGVVQAMRNKVGSDRLIVMLEFGSRTMQRHVDIAALRAALMPADSISALHTTEIEWDTTQLTAGLENKMHFLSSVDELVEHWVSSLQATDHVLVLSNKHFHGLTDKLCRGLSE